jgi:hypothetical protein
MFTRSLVRRLNLPMMPSLPWGELAVGLLILLMLLQA